MFQYDYLNNDVTDFGEVDYKLSNNVPMALRRATADAKTEVEGVKPILVLINPPYAEAANSQGNGGKTGVARTRISFGMDHLGYAARELFVQFVHRIARELTAATLAMLSTLKYGNAPNFETFRGDRTAKYLDGFVVPSKVFELKGSFPICFLMWGLARVELADAIHTLAFDRSGNLIGEKRFFNIPNERFLSSWLPRLKASAHVIPLENAVVPLMAFATVTTWHEGSIGYLLSNSNDPQHSGTLTALYSLVCSQGNGYYVTPDDLWQAAIVFAVRYLLSRRR